MICKLTPYTDNSVNYATKLNTAVILVPTVYKTIENFQKNKKPNIYLM